MWHTFPWQNEDVHVDMIDASWKNTMKTNNQIFFFEFNIFAFDEIDALLLHMLKQFKVIFLQSVNVLDVFPGNNKHVKLRSWGSVRENHHLVVNVWKWLFISNDLAEFTDLISMRKLVSLLFFLRLIIYFVKIVNLPFFEKPSCKFECC